MAYLGASPLASFASPSKDTFSGDNSTTAFTMGQSVGDPNQIEVFVDNVRQEPTSAYTVNGTTLTFTGTPATGSNNIYVIHKQGVIGNGLIPTSGRSSDRVGSLTVDGNITASGFGSISASTVTSSGLVTANADMLIGGATPTLTIGDAGAEDTKIVFDGNAQDFHVGLDDSADDLVIGVGSALGTTTAIAVDENAVVNFANTPTVASAAAKSAGKETIWVPALAMYGNTTNGAEAGQTELGNGPELKTLAFDKDSDEFAQFAVAFPKSWNEGTITFQAFFTGNSTNTGNVAWKLAGTALADNGSLNTAFGTAVQATAKAHSGTAYDLDVTAESGAVTIAGSPSTDEYVFFEVSRDVSADNFSADALLLGVKLFFTTDAGNDA
jgi:hypothetical protein